MFFGKRKILRMVQIYKYSLRKRPNWQLCLHAAIVDTFWEYTMNTRVSGIWLLRQNRTEGVWRRCWASVLIILFLSGIYLALQLWLKFYSYPILNTISNHIPITEVAFPGITICSPKVVNVERVKRYIETLDIPENYDTDEVATGFEFINAFTDPTWVSSNNNSTAYLITDAILLHNNVSLYEAAMNVSANCDDFVRHCFFGSYVFNCTQNHTYFSFIPTTSYMGPCCSFNYNPRNLSYTPFTSDIFGIDGALTIIGVEGSERNLSTGLLILVHHPMDFVTEAAASVTITPNSENFVQISPTVQSSSKEVLELSERKRDCLISDDVSLKRYRRASCLVACQSEIIMEKCKCQPYYLPNANAENECKLSDLVCYTEVYDTFKSAKCNQCLPNCNDVTYTTLAYKTDLLQHNYSISSFYSLANYSKDTYMVRIYLENQAVPAIRKVTTMSWTGLLSDLGGVFNLCLGLSMVSVVEFFYYCTYRLSINYKMHKVLMQ